MLKSEPRYEDEPMDTGELLYDEYDEEGEIHSSDDEQNHRSSEKTSENQPEKRKSIFGGASPSPTEAVNEEELKKLERAKRFSIPFKKSNVQTVNNETLTELYKSMGIDSENEKHYRFNAIHMRGTKDMSTEDVFEYFSLYPPSFIEWINDVSCNLVWPDDVSAAKVMLNISKEIINLDKIRLNADPFEKDMKTKESEIEVFEDSSSVDARTIKSAIPPGFWRLGKPAVKSPAILLRFATRSDRKQKNAERNSEYYKRYGNPHFGNLTGLVSNSLRSEYFKRLRHPATSEMSENDRGFKDKNPWGHLAQEWNELDKKLEKPRGDVRIRISLKRPLVSTVQKDLRYSINSKYKKRNRDIGVKYDVSHNSSDSGEEDDDDDDEYNTVKVPRMRMYADEEEELEINSNRPKLSSQVQAAPVEDLRNKIDRRKRNKQVMSGAPSANVSRGQWNKFKRTEEEEENESDEYENNWALEQYSDLRESLEQNKKMRNYKERTKDRYESKENDSGENTSDDMYDDCTGHRSPLQIEIENDEYFENESF